MACRMGAQSRQVASPPVEGAGPLVCFVLKGMALFYVVALLALEFLE